MTAAHRGADCHSAAQIFSPRINHRTARRAAREHRFVAAPAERGAEHDAPGNKQVAAPVNHGPAGPAVVIDHLRAAAIDQGVQGRTAAGYRLRTAAADIGTTGLAAIDHGLRIGTIHREIVHHLARADHAVSRMGRIGQQRQRRNHHGGNRTKTKTRNGIEQGNGEPGLTRG